MFFKSEKT